MNLRRSVDAIVLSGGGSRRLGRPKTVEPVGGRALLARVTDALSEVGRVVIVGAPDGASRADVVVREDPVGGGPLAGLCAGLPEVRAEVTLVLAGDLPFLTAATLGCLVAALTDEADVALALDDHGRDQYLLAAWRTDSLRPAIERAGRPPAGTAKARGGRLGALYTGTRVNRIQLTGTPPPWWDCDTPADLACAREWAGG